MIPAATRKRPSVRHQARIRIGPGHALPVPKGSPDIRGNSARQTAWKNCLLSCDSAGSCESLWTRRSRPSHGRTNDRGPVCGGRGRNPVGYLWTRPENPWAARRVIGRPACTLIGRRPGIRMSDRLIQPSQRPNEPSRRNTQPKLIIPAPFGVGQVKAPKGWLLSFSQSPISLSRQR